MEFSDSIDQDSFGLFFYVIVEGIPWVFGNVPRPYDTTGASWNLAIDGDTFQWSDTLISESIDIISMQADARAGIGSSGGITLEFELTGTQEDSTSDTWLSLMTSNINRTDGEYTPILRDIAPTATSVSVDDASIAIDADMYIGVETLSSSSRNTGSTPELLNSVSRGKYLGRARRHEISTDNAENQGDGPRLSSFARRLVGRKLEFWMCPGVPQDDGTILSYGVGPRTSSDKVFRFFISDVKFDNSLQRVVMSCVGLEQILALRVARILPRAVGGAGFWEGRGQYETPGLPRVVVAEDNDTISWAWTLHDSTAGAVLLNYPNHGIRLQRDSSTPGTPEDVPHGIYTISVLESYIQYTILNGNKPDAAGSASVDNPSDLSVNIELVADKFKRKTRIIFQSDVTANDVWHLTIPVKGATPKENILKEIGFEEDKFIEPETTGGIVYWKALSDRGICTFRWPDSTYPIRPLYYCSDTGPVFVDPGYDDDNGDTVGIYVRVGKEEVVKISSISATGDRYLTISARGQFGTEAGEETYIEYDTEKPQRVDIVQGLAFKGVSEERMILYLILGGSGLGGDYEDGWHGSGASIDPAVIDITGMEAIYHDNPEPADNWFIDEATELRSIVQQVLRLKRLHLVARAGKLTMVPIEPPLESEASASIVINSTVMDSTQGITLESSEQNIVNRIKFKLGYDNAKKKYRATDGVANHTQSLAEWGEKDVLDVEVRGHGNWVEASDRVQVLSHHMFSAWGSVYRMIRLAINWASAWAWEVGDTAVLTHPGIPNFSTPGRGVEDLLGRLYEVNVNPRPSDGGPAATILFVSRVADGQTATALCPSIRLSARTSDTEWTCDQHRFSDSTDTLKDMEHYTTDYLVRVFPPGNDSAGYAGVGIATLTPGTDTIIFDTALTGLVAPLIVEFEAYDASLDTEQRLYAYGSSGLGFLNAKSGTEPAKYYS